MAFLDHNGESEFPMSKDRVFEAMRKAIPTINGLKIENADKLQGRFIVKAGVSLHSWDENIPIQLTEISETRTKVQITSSPKTGIMFGGAFDMGKNRRNIENILSSTSKILSSENETTNSEIKYRSDFQSINNQRNNFQNTPNLNAWYEKTWLIIILCIIIFPIGLYALWKNSSISKGWKIIVTVIISLIVLTNLGSKDKTSTSSKETPITIETEKQNTMENPPVKNTEQDKAGTEKEAVIQKLKTKAKEDWPDDFTTQEFWLNEQVDAYEYMLNIENNSIKAKAQRDWPLDFSTQKFWYNEQIEAQERMK